jgi:serine/threonine-protein kinase
MGVVHYGRLRGSGDFSRTVAIKRLHTTTAQDPEFVAAFLDEARLAARVRHSNVVQTIDVLEEDGELYIVMEYVPGIVLSSLTSGKSKTLIPPRIASAILGDVLQGLNAAHEARDEKGQPLDLVHRDVSPQNVLVGADGIARVMDFGIAKAAGRSQVTRQGEVKGKFAYMAPEQALSAPLDRRADVFAAAVVLWELFTHERLFQADSEGGKFAKLLTSRIPPPTELMATLPPAIDEVVLRGLERAPASRYPSAREMARDLEVALPPASHAEVADWLETVAHDEFAEQARRLEEIERNAPAPPAVRRRSSSRPPRTEDSDRGPDVTLTAPQAQPVVPRRRRMGWVAGGLAVLALAGFAVTRLAAARQEPTSTELRPQTNTSGESGGDGSAPPLPFLTATAWSAQPSPTGPPHITAPLPNLRVRRPPAAAPRPASSAKCEWKPVTLPDGTTDFKRVCPSP